MTTLSMWKFSRFELSFVWLLDSFTLKKCILSGDSLQLMKRFAALCEVIHSLSSRLIASTDDFTTMKSRSRSHEQSERRSFADDSTDRVFSAHHWGSNIPSLEISITLAILTSAIQAFGAKYISSTWI
jgi:hypothetical protein